MVDSLCLLEALNVPEIVCPCYGQKVKSNDYPGNDSLSEPKWCVFVGSTYFLVAYQSKHRPSSRNSLSPYSGYRVKSNG